MRTSFYLATIDWSKNIKFALFVLLQFIVFGAFASLAAMQVMDFMPLRTYIERTEEMGLVTFKSYYKTSNLFVSISSEVRDELISVFDVRTDAYSYSLAGSAMDYPNKNVYFVVGSFASIFDIGIRSDMMAPSAFIGADITDIQLNDAITIGLEQFIKVPVIGVLNPNATFFHRGYEIDLNDSILVVISFKQLDTLFKGFYNEELIQNCGFIQPEISNINQFMNVVNQSQIISIIPHPTKQLLMEQYRFIIDSSVFFLLFYAIAFLFCICGILVNLYVNIKRNMREYAVHLIYGAVLRDIYERIWAYLLLITAPSVFCAITSVFVIMPQLSASWYIFAIGAIFVVILSSFIAIYPCIQLGREGVLSSLRRD